MIREIHEQPESIRRTLEYTSKMIEEIAVELNSKTLKMIYVTGSGSSYHAGLIAQNIVSSLTSLPISAIPASELPFWTPPHYPKNTVVIAISQSGESKDVVTAMREAASRGSKIIGITNSKDSTLYEECDYSILTEAGLEKAVTATKTFTAQLAVIYLLSFSLISEASIADEYFRQLHRIPSILEGELPSLDAHIREVAERLHENNVFFLLGSGPNYAIALEGALKLKEACNIIAEGFASREFLHGPLQLIRENTPVIILSTISDKGYVTSLIDNFSHFKAPIVSLSQNSGVYEKSDVENIVLAEDLNSMLTSLVYIVPLQLLAYYNSILRGLNPDQPEKLSKVVKG